MLEHFNLGPDRWSEGRHCSCVQSLLINENRPLDLWVIVFSVKSLCLGSVQPFQGSALSKSQANVLCICRRSAKSFMSGAVLQCCTKFHQLLQPRFGCFPALWESRPCSQILMPSSINKLDSASCLHLTLTNRDYGCFSFSQYHKTKLFPLCREIMAALLYARMVTSRLSWAWASMAEAALGRTSLASSLTCLSTHSGYIKFSEHTPTLSRFMDSIEVGD